MKASTMNKAAVAIALLGAAGAAVFAIAMMNRTSSGEPQRPAPRWLHVEVDGRTPEEQDAISRAVAVWRDACAGATKHSSDVESARATIGDASMYQAEEFGWRRAVYIAVTLKEQVQTMPASWGAGGHVLHYYVGNGREPGIDMAKRVSAHFCGYVPHDDGSNQFVAASDARFLPN